MRRVALPEIPVKWLLPAQVFVGGAAVMALEMLGSRLLAPRFGSTLYVWGSLIGVVMAALAAGAWVGGRRADDKPSPDALARVLFLAGVVVALLPFASPWVLAGIDRSGLDIVWGPLAASVLLLGPPTFLLGMATPFAVRLSATVLAEVGGIAGRVSALSTTGSIAGTFATVFVLVPNFRVPALISGLAILLLVLAFFGLREKRGAVAVVVLLALVTPAGGQVAERLVLDIGQTVAYRSVFETESAYHHIEVMEDRGSGPDHARHLFMDGLLHGSQFTGDWNGTPTKYVPYFHLASVWRENVTRALFIGAGTFSGPRQFLDAYPNATVDVVEIDPVVVDVADRYFHAPVDDPRVRVVTEDGRRFLRDADGGYDVIVLDAYSRTFVPFHLMTAEFFFEVHDRLAPDGVLVMNLIASTSGAASGILKAEVKTMQQAFRHVDVFPVNGAQGVMAQNLILVATDADAPEDVEARAAAVAPATAPDLARYAGYRTSVDTFGAPVLKDDFAPVEILLNPVTRAPFTRGE